MEVGHSIGQVKIAQDVVVVVCTCGWESPGRPSELEATSLWTVHAQKASE